MQQLHVLSHHHSFARMMPVRLATASLTLACCVSRQVDGLAGRVDELPSPEDWNIMEQALAAILDEAAARAQEEDRLAEEAAGRGGGPLGFIEEEEEAVQASSGESRGAAARQLLALSCPTFTIDRRQNQMSRPVNTHQLDMLLQRCAGRQVLRK